MNHFKRNRKCFCLAFVVVVIIVFYLIYGPKLARIDKLLLDTENIDFAALSLSKPNLNETGLEFDIIPNIVHFIRFRNPYVDFVLLIAIKSVLINHKPEKIYIHCDCVTLKGKYWELLSSESKIFVRKIEEPKYVFGHKLSSVYHASDVARIKVLMDFGGIFLDNDVFVVKSLKKFLKFEFSIGWPINDYLGTQVLIAHKNARFLKLWFQSYRDYRPFKWYYNAGELPTESILTKRPDLVHREMTEFGVHNLVEFLYKNNHPEEIWRSKFYTIHLLERHRSYMVPEDSIGFFNENNIKTYNKTFGAMARSVLF
ncbi:uncharacterized protein B4U79_07596 [Dinothrombium tinctorium]|uniref:Uncharacterized protein n=1 Tax=Dinothrombium tinctorium TaxID=1965070 RepID=A0A443QRR8_9ACAR|nr:uncharacterized protein B4U79_08329 [Dinothrombium tinctorium]RWS05706.1 uncharacterized protein B4U79_13645 [Dinothrombium tinctorium]RWS06511.1 uncharacterized protein B4U79_04375 [Dinothrombium tinctorium]RWS07515.1 uncharacterized protein B4U79_07596 [Dinothrombium tinctorium]